MKQIVLILMSILSFSCSSQTQRQATDTTEPVSKKILVAYFSCTEETAGRVAESIAGAVYGPLCRITPAEAYTSADLDWNDKSSRSSGRNGRRGFSPRTGLGTSRYERFTISYFSAILFGGTCIARPVNTFLEKYDFSGKTVIPFATSGGSSIAHSVRQLRKLYPNVTWNDGKLLNGGVAVATEWAKQVVENGKKESR